jgi:hypothetical protein
MDKKILDLNKSVYELSNDDSEIPKILEKLGFDDITKPGMLSTMGRFMTIPKGSKAKKIEIEIIKEEFIKNGYEIKE